MTEQSNPIPAPSRTFMMIKPDAVRGRSIGAIIATLENHGFEVVRIRDRQLTPAFVDHFYAEHVGKPYYPPHQAFMVSGLVVGLELRGENAIGRLRGLAGASDRAKALQGTFRQRFGRGMPENAVHSSDSSEAALREAQLFFDTFAYRDPREFGADEGTCG